MIKLSVNVNKVALLRNSRSNGIPNVARLAAVTLDSGAHGITVHPRPDERHIRSADVTEICDLVRRRVGLEFNVEGNPFHGLLDHVRKVLPDQCTLVPDAPDAATSDHGWNLAGDAGRLKPVIRELRDLGVRVSLFMDPDPLTMRIARDLGAHRVELYTEPYAMAFVDGNFSRILDTYAMTARSAVEAGLEVNAGHDLNRENLPEFVAAIPFLSEVSIGHALIADALEVGMAEATRMYLAALTLNAKGVP
jgi:pyridoxine 5-phosphate synthase